MQKTEAIELLGGSLSEAARVVGISYQAVSKWPDTLSPRVADRVQAALWRQRRTAVEVPSDLGGAAEVPAQQPDGLGRCRDAA